MLNTSIWLIPRKAQEENLQNIINNLAKTYSAYPFVPHITAYYLQNSMELKNVINIIENAIKNMKIFHLTLENISYSDIFTKTLFAKYAISPALQDLYDKLKEQFYSNCPYELNPHLSLLYKKNMEEKDKKKEADQLNVPQQLFLDRLMVITKPGPIISEEKDVLEWKVAYQIQFGK